MPHSDRWHYRSRGGWSHISAVELGHVDGGVWPRLHPLHPGICSGRHRLQHTGFPDAVLYRTRLRQRHDSRSKHFSDWERRPLKTLNSTSRPVSIRLSWPQRFGEPADVWKALNVITFPILEVLLSCPKGFFLEHIENVFNVGVWTWQDVLAAQYCPEIILTRYGGKNKTNNFLCISRSQSLHL